MSELERLRTENAGLRQQLAAAQARARQGARLLNWVRSYWQGKLLLPHPDGADESGLAELFDEISAWLKEKSDHAALDAERAAAREEGANSRDAEWTAILDKRVAAAQREGRDEAAKWCVDTASVFQDRADDPAVSAWLSRELHDRASALKQAADAIRALRLE